MASPFKQNSTAGPSLDERKKLFAAPYADVLETAPEVQAAGAAAAAASAAAAAAAGGAAPSNVIEEIRQASKGDHARRHELCAAGVLSLPSPTGGQPLAARRTFAQLLVERAFLLTSTLAPYPGDGSNAAAAPAAGRPNSDAAACARPWVEAACGLEPSFYDEAANRNVEWASIWDDNPRGSPYLGSRGRLRDSDGSVLRYLLTTDVASANTEHSLFNWLFRRAGRPESAGCGGGGGGGGPAPEPVVLSHELLPKEWLPNAIVGGAHGKRGGMPPLGHLRRDGLVLDASSHLLLCFLSYPRPSARWCAYGAVLAHGKETRRHRRHHDRFAGAAAGSTGASRAALQFSPSAKHAVQRGARDAALGDDRPELKGGDLLNFDAVGCAALTDGNVYNFLLHAYLQFFLPDPRDWCTNSPQGGLIELDQLEFPSRPPPPTQAESAGVLGVNAQHGLGGVAYSMGGGGGGHAPGGANASNNGRLCELKGWGKIVDDVLNARRRQLAGLPLQGAMGMAAALFEGALPGAIGRGGGGGGGGGSPAPGGGGVGGASRRGSAHEFLSPSVGLAAKEGAGCGPWVLPISHGAVKAGEDASSRARRIGGRLECRNLQTQYAQKQHHYVHGGSGSHGRERYDAVVHNAAAIKDNYMPTQDYCGESGAWGATPHTEVFLLLVRDLWLGGSRTSAMGAVWAASADGGDGRAARAGCVGGGGGGAASMSVDADKVKAMAELATKSLYDADDLYVQHVGDLYVFACGRAAALEELLRQAAEQGGSNHHAQQQAVTWKALKTEFDDIVDHFEETRPVEEMGAVKDAMANAKAVAKRLKMLWKHAPKWVDDDAPLRKLQRKGRSLRASLEQWQRTNAGFAEWERSRAPPLFVLGAWDERRARDAVPPPSQAVLEALLLTVTYLQAQCDPARASDQQEAAMHADALRAAQGAAARDGGGAWGALGSFGEELLRLMGRPLSGGGAAQARGGAFPGGGGGGGGGGARSSGRSDSTHRYPLHPALLLLQPYLFRFLWTHFYNWRGDGDDGSQSGGGGARGGHQHVWPLLVELWLALLEPWKARARLGTLCLRTTLSETTKMPKHKDSPQWRGVQGRCHGVSMPQPSLARRLDGAAMEALVEVEGEGGGAARASLWYDDVLNEDELEACLAGPPVARAPGCGGGGGGGARPATTPKLAAKQRQKGGATRPRGPPPPPGLNQDLQHCHAYSCEWNLHVASGHHFYTSLAALFFRCAAAKHKDDGRSNKRDKNRAQSADAVMATRALLVLSQRGLLAHLSLVARLVDPVNIADAARGRRAAEKARAAGGVVFNGDDLAAGGAAAARVLGTDHATGTVSGKEGEALAHLFRCHAARLVEELPHGADEPLGGGLGQRRSSFGGGAGGGGGGGGGVLDRRTAWAHGVTRSELGIAMYDSLLSLLSGYAGEGRLHKLDALCGRKTPQVDLGGAVSSGAGAGIFGSLSPQKMAQRGRLHTNRDCSSAFLCAQALLPSVLRASLERKLGVPQGSAAQAVARQQLKAASASGMTALANNAVAKLAGAWRDIVEGGIGAVPKEALVGAGAVLLALLFGGGMYVAGAALLALFFPQLRPMGMAAAAGTAAAGAAADDGQYRRPNGIINEDYDSHVPVRGSTLRGGLRSVRDVQFYGHAADKPCASYESVTVVRSLNALFEGVIDPTLQFVTGEKTAAEWWSYTTDGRSAWSGAGARLACGAALSIYVAYRMAGP